MSILCIIVGFLLGAAVATKVTIKMTDEEIKVYRDIIENRNQVIADYQKLCEQIHDKLRDITEDAS